ncbi:MAG: primosomal protein N' [Chloracidobacterium sp.]|nr:primosomal protein N' [Chloracidobacterium sp.]MCO5334324.1 primosomal protein N' [Pyrinomonadaceae bacterium]
MAIGPAPRINGPRYIEAALPVPLRRVFTYRVPEGISDEIALGTRVQVPFGRRELTGYVVAIHDELPQEFSIEDARIRDVIAALDTQPLITPEILRLTQWTADHYAGFWGEVLKASLPAGLHNEKVRPKRRKAVRLTSEPPHTALEKPISDQQQKIIAILKQGGGEMLFTELLDRAGVGTSPLNTLARRGMVEIFVQDVRRDPLRGAALPAKKDIALTPQQTDALTQIAAAITKSDYKAFLLHGVTGSGKTEIYIRAIQQTLSEGRSALMLVPEIALTPIFSRRLRAVFGSNVAILHSELSAGERFDEWRRIRLGSAKVAIGTRSAIFAPLENIGLIVVDEEHDASYRQQESPFYNARDVAVMRAHFAKAAVVLGSATPAMESFYNARSGKYAYLHLPDRIGDIGLAKAELIDMRDVFRQTGKDVPVAPELMAAIDETHDRGEQAIILLNRRGFSQFVLCRTCGEAIRCQNCDITLTFHRREGKLACHYCGYQVPSPKVCPHCSSEFLYFVGEGTENIEDRLRKRFPEMNIGRVDRDTMKHKGDLERVLFDFASHKIDLLVGTQMIAKGHDFPNVTLVGVIGIDIGLGLPDLRSAERTFQLITQVAGRSGRGDKQGRVLIQTYYPEHYALRHAVRQDYIGFYEEEIKYRERFAYPPFYVLASIMIRHRDQRHASQNANLLRRALDDANSQRYVRILGPASASVGRLRNEYRMQIILKARSRKGLRQTLDTALADAEHRGADMRSFFVEIDPIDLL